MLELEELTNSTIGAAMQVQSALGPSLLESSYRACLARELALRGHAVAQEVSLEVQYEGLVLPQAYRMDLVIDGKLVVALKTVEHLSPAP
jgi:GxxExxY protein